MYSFLYFLTFGHKKAARKRREMLSGGWMVAKVVPSLAVSVIAGGAPCG